MKKRVLVTAAGGDIGSAIIRTIKDYSREYEIIGCDINRFNQALEYIDEFLIIPKYIDLDYMKCIKKICMEKAINAVIPVTEYEILLFNKEREWFTDNDISLIINNSNIIDICTSKYATSSFLNENKITTPKTLLNATEIKNMQFPVIIKPDFSCGSRSLRIVYSEKELQNYINKFNENYVVQEYIGSVDSEYTVGIFRFEETIRYIAFKRKLEENGGMTVFVERLFDPLIEKICIQVARAIKLQGYINIQMRKQNDKYYIFEINPRISGSVGFRYKMGFKDVIWWLQMSLENRKPEEYVPLEGQAWGVKKYDEYVSTIN